MLLKKYNLSDLTKTIFLFIIYFFCNKLLMVFFDRIGINNCILISFVADLIFLLISFLLYKKEIITDFNNINSNYKLKDILKTIFKYLVLLFLINFIISVIANILLVNVEELNSIQNLVNESTMYLVFKSLIFSPLAETLLFQKSTRKIIHNNFIYIFFSAVTFTLINIIYMDLNSQYFVFDVIGYFIMTLIFCYIYVKTDNIFFVVFIKFLYNLIPLMANIILLMEVL